MANRKAPTNPTPKPAAKTTSRSKTPAKAGKKPGNPLLEPLVLPNGSKLRNRVIKAAMTERLAGPQHAVTKLHTRLYSRWSEGKAALMITGNIMVDSRSLESARNLVAESPSAVASLQQLVAAGKSHGNLIWAQISHSGRQTNRFVNPRPVSASNVRVRQLMLYARPRALSTEEIADIVRRFITTATLCQKAGFDGVQIHAAHGYLLSQFLSPLSNKRTDDYGGSLQNRARLLLEIIEGVRKATGRKFGIGVKLNSSDFQKGGFSEEESAETVKMLSKAGIDLLEISGGNYENPGFFTSGKQVRESTARREAYFLEYAVKVRKFAKMPLMITGGFRDPVYAAGCLKRRELDAIGMARPFLVDPAFAMGFLALQSRTADIPALRTGMGRSVDTIAEAGWHNRQISRIAKGLEPDMKLSALTSAIHLLMMEFNYAVLHHLYRLTRRT